MKQVLVLLDDEDYHKLVEAKGALTWRAFMLSMIKEQKNR